MRESSRTSPPAARSNCWWSESREATRHGCSCEPADPRRSATCSSSRAMRAPRSSTATTGSGGCGSPARVRSWHGSMRTAMCRCRPTSRAAQAGRQRALPDRVRARAGCGRRANRRPALRCCVTGGTCRARHRRGVRHAACRRRHLPSGEDERSLAAPDARRVVSGSPRRRLTQWPRRLLGAAASSRSAPPACALWSRRSPRMDYGWGRRRPRSS